MLILIDYFTEKSNSNNVKDGMTASDSRQLSASSADAISSAAAEESRSETSVSDVGNLIWGDFGCSAAVQVRNAQASAISLVQQFVDEPNIEWRDDPLLGGWDVDKSAVNLFLLHESHFASLRRPFPANGSFLKLDS